MRDELLVLVREIYLGVKEKAMFIGLDENLLFGGVTEDIEKKVHRLAMADTEQDSTE
jgi:hypothetical protein